MRFLRFSIFILFVIKRSSAACPSDWFQNGDSCYYSSGSSTLTWHEAASKCESMRGYLVIINDQTEDTFLTNQMTTSRAYIGLHDLYEEDQWVWVDGTPMTYAAWAAGQPDNWQDAPSSQENCGQIMSDGLWNDVHCSAQYSYFCERGVDVVDAPNCDEAAGWKEFNGKCYLLVDAKVPWTTANQGCKLLSSDLVAVTTEEKQIFVANMVNQHNQHSWIGLSSVDHESNDLHWSNGKDIFDQVSYTKWASGQPALSQTSDNCVEITPSTTDGGLWSTERCGEGHSYVCESPFLATCEQGWRMFNGNCYFVASSSTVWTNWEEALATCDAMGAALLKITNGDEQQYVTYLLHEISDAGSPGVWLGMSDSETDGEFKWSDGQLVSDSDYTFWAQTQPVNTVNTWDCGELFSGSDFGFWEMNKNCFKKQAFICKIPTGVPVSSVTPPATTHQGCPPGWIWYDSSCYLYEYASPTSWDVAEQMCVNYGAHLVSILTGEENGFVVGHAKDDMWIGGHAKTTQGDWKWSDGSPWLFQDWATGEPNLSGECAQFWAGNSYKWDDLPCSNPRAYICKMPETDCIQALGMEDYRIPDEDITASSSYDANHASYLARLNNQKSAPLTGSWSVGLINGVYPTIDTYWIQVRFLVPRTIHGVTTQGRPADHIQYVKTYALAYSNDGVLFNDVTEFGTRKIFTANTDVFTPVTNILKNPIVTSYLRLYPQTYEVWASMRMEILGCKSSEEDLNPPSTDELCTAVHPPDRLDCGYAGVSYKECLNKGCCYDNTVPNVNWCFYPKGSYDSRCGADWSFDPAGEFFCYHFNDYNMRTWTQAKDYCIEMGGNLLSINSPFEQAYVSGQISSKVRVSAMWIGANNLDLNKGWTWADGSPFNYIYWQDGEPNGHTGDENCVEMYTGDSKWNDIKCSNLKGIACRKFANTRPPIPIDSNNYIVNICEDEVGTLFCEGNAVIVVHHASYGRSNIETCTYSDVVIPIEGCHSSDSLDVVSKMCNNKQYCTIPVTNDIFGDPCYGIYKYLNVIYSCEALICYQGLGVENGTVQNYQITQSSSLDNQHTGADGRLNGARSWSSNEGIGAWVQVTFPVNFRISGIIIQGANDAERYVTKFKVGFANDQTFTQWTDYTNYDNIVQNFTGNTDTTTQVRGVLAEHVFSAGIRIYPLEWSGDVIGMRFEITGCNPLKELKCEELGETLFRDGDGAEAPEGTTVTGECPGFCPIIAAPPAVFGTTKYAGMSQVCSAAVHAGVIIDKFGGPVTLIKVPAQSTYVGSVRNLVVSQDFDYYPMAFSFTNTVKNCPHGWVPYESHCYYVSDNEDELNFAESEARCVQMGAHLVSIGNAVEQDFVHQTISRWNHTHIWIGLNDLKTPNFFEWIDGQPITYTSWNPIYAPTMNIESCVNIWKDVGDWNDYYCDIVQGYMCKKVKGYYTSDDTEPPTLPPGCAEGWVPNDGSCFWFERNLVDETAAEGFCEGKGGTLIHIKDRFVQSFLHTLIGAEDLRWWLGLHANPSGENGVAWEWESGDPVTYSNWGYGNPDINLGECTTFYGGVVGNGLWYSTRCTKQAYPICEVPREGWTTPVPTTPPPVGGCPYDWSTPDTSDPSCYKVFNQEESTNHNKKQAWNNAWHQCLSYNADLVSIHSRDEQSYLITVLAQLGIISESLWIGLNNKAQLDWGWSDGSPVEYVDWGLGSPSLATDNNCVAMKFEPSIGTGLWDNLNCEQPLDWICKKKKGTEVVEPTQLPTGVPNPQCGSDTEGTWLYYNEICYLFNDQAVFDSYDADRKCQSLGGYLLSVHSGEEQSFITNQIKQMSGSDRFWIGLKEEGGINGAYQWMDGSPVQYVNWNQGEPSDSLGMEQCVAMYKKNGRWNDANCGLQYASYICKKFIGSPPAPPNPTQPWPGGCPADWLEYKNYCFQMHGESNKCDFSDTTTPECSASWADAHNLCFGFGGDLATIHNKYENAFLVAQSIRMNHNYWIGLSDIQWGNKYTWANGEEVTFTNWNHGEPNHHNGEENCAESLHAEGNAGRWNDEKCWSSKPYVCSRGKDPNLEGGLQINNNARCPQGWTQFDTINEQFVCYYLDTTLRSFEDARSNCQSMNSDLVSLQSMYEQYFLVSYIEDRISTAWIGLSLDKDLQEWTWVDGWPLWISNWGENQPGSDASKTCVLNVATDSGAEWLTANCNDLHSSICKTSSENIPATPGYVDGECENPSWPQLGGFCYFFHITEGNNDDIGVTWADAERFCNNLHGHLVSFESRSEVEWVLGWFNYSEPMWIGLTKNTNDGWAWSDNRPVSFTYWSTGEPNDAHDTPEDCVEMYGDTGKWNDISCLNKHGYMCRVPKVIGTDSNGDHIHYTTPRTEEPDEESNYNVGIILGVIIGVILAILLFGGLAFYFIRVNPPAASKLSEGASDLTKGFTNKLYSISGDKPSEQTESPTVRYEKESGATVDDSNA